MSIEQPPQTDTSINRYQPVFDLALSPMTEADLRTIADRITKLTESKYSQYLLVGRLELYGFDKNEILEIVKNTDRSAVSQKLYEVIRRQYEMEKEQFTILKERINPRIDEGMEKLVSMFPDADLNSMHLIEYRGRMQKLLYMSTDKNIPIIGSVGYGGVHDLGINKTFVFYTKETKDEAVIHAHVHESTHMLANTEKVSEGVNVSGFHREPIGDEEDVSSLRYINEGFTDIIARKALDGVVDYKKMAENDEEAGFYQVLVDKVNGLIKFVAKQEGVDEAKIEADLLKIYSEKGSHEKMHEFIAKYTGPLGYALIHIPELDLNKFLELWTKHNKDEQVDEKLTIREFRLPGDKIEEIKKMYPFIEIVNEDK